MGKPGFQLVWSTQKSLPEYKGKILRRGTQKLWYDCLPTPCHSKRSCSLWGLNLACLTYQWKGLRVWLLGLLF